MAIRIAEAGLDDSSGLSALFAATFTASEGAGEGRLIGRLVDDLLCAKPPDTARVFVASDGGEQVAGCAFTPLRFASQHIVVVLLAPVAVLPGWQGRGIGQPLLRHGLQQIAAAGAEVAVTYGDPAFYGKLGFQQVDVDTIPPPRSLSQPYGWQALSLTGKPLVPLPGPCHCVPAFDHAALW